MASSYLYLLIIWLAFTLTQQALLSSDESVLNVANNIQQDYETGMQQLLSFCGQKTLWRAKIDSQLNNLGFKVDGRVTKNSLISALNSLQNQQRDIKYASAKDVQINEAFTIHIWNFLTFLWQWFQGFVESLQLNFWLASIIVFSRIGIRDCHQQIVVKIAKVLSLQNVIIYIYAKFVATVHTSFQTTFYLLFFQLQFLQSLRYCLDWLQIRRQIVTKVILSKQMGKRPLLESISAKDLNIQINDVCSICCATYSYEDIVQFSSQEKKESGRYFVVKTACNHYFHLFCLNQWISSGNNICPFDKAPIHTFKID